MKPTKFTYVSFGLFLYICLSICSASLHAEEEKSVTFNVVDKWPIEKARFIASSEGSTYKCSKDGCVIEETDTEYLMRAKTDKQNFYESDGRIIEKYYYFSAKKATHRLTQTWNYYILTPKTATKAATAGQQVSK